MGGDRKQVTICSTNDSFNKALRLVLEGVDVTIGPDPSDVDGNPHLIVWLMDEDLPLADLARVISARPTLILGPPDTLMDAVDAGCIGFLANDAPLEEIRDAVDTILQGGAVVSPDLLGRILRRLVHRRRDLSELAIKNGLTEREHEVLLLAADGLRKDQIAERLYISPATARTHLQRVYRKLGVHSQAELMAIAVTEDPHNRSQT